MPCLLAFSAASSLAHASCMCTACTSAAFRLARPGTASSCQPPHSPRHTDMVRCSLTFQDDLVLLLCLLGQLFPLLTAAVDAHALPLIAPITAVADACTSRQGTLCHNRSHPNEGVFTSILSHTVMEARRKEPDRTRALILALESARQGKTASISLGSRSIRQPSVRRQEWRATHVRPVLTMEHAEVNGSSVPSLQSHTSSFTCPQHSGACSYFHPLQPYGTTAISGLFQLNSSLPSILSLTQLSGIVFER